MPDWNEVLQELQQLTGRANATAQNALDIIRKKYLNQMANDTGRNVIAYYSGWLSKPDVAQTEINDEDKNGFMMCVRTIGQHRRKGLDLILHTPGGSIAATESLVNYLHQMFGPDIRAIIPQLAMSAGTMIACSCKEIIIAKHANLGPIDPHVRGFPAYGVKEEFKRACKEVAKDPSTIPIWSQIISKYGPTFLSQCENAIDWSKQFVEGQLEHVMFDGKPDAKKKAQKIVRKLTDYKGNKTHARHIHFEELHDMGLDVCRLEDVQWLQDIVLTVHHCYMHSLMNSTAIKIIENNHGSAFVKHQMVQQLMQIQQGKSQ
jgi:ClpP class serine protease